MSSIEIKRVVSWSVVTYHYISSDPLHELIPIFNDIAHVKVGTSDTSDLLKKWQLLLPSISPIDFMTIILLQFFTNDSVSRRIIFLLFVFIVFYCGRFPLILHWWRIYDDGRTWLFAMIQILTLQKMGLKHIGKWTHYRWRLKKISQPSHFRTTE